MKNRAAAALDQNPRKNCCFAVRNAEKVGGLRGVSRLLSTLLKSGSNLSPQPPHRSLCLKIHGGNAVALLRPHFLNFTNPFHVMCFIIIFSRPKTPRGKIVIPLGQTISRPERDERTVLQAHADAAAADPIIRQLGAIIKCRFPALQVLNTVDSNLHA